MFIFAQGALGQTAPSSDLSLFKARDLEWRAGEIKFQETDDYGSGNPLNASSLHDLAFAAPDKFNERVQCLSGRNSGTTYDFVQDGAVLYYSIQSPASSRQKIIFIKSDKDWPRISSDVQSVMPGPCLAVGRGLSSYNWQAEASTSQATKLTTLLPNSESLTVQTDPTSGLLTRAQITRGPGAKVLFDWSFSKAQRKGNIWIVPTSTVKMVIIASKTVTRTYSLQSVSLASPASATLTIPWFDPGKDVQDDRAQTPVLWSYKGLLRATGGKTSLTPQQLLELSQKESAAEAEAGAKSRAGEQAIKQGRSLQGSYASLVAFLAIVVILAVGIAAFVRAKRRTKR